MENLDANGMQTITAYAPARIAILGLLRTLYGLVLWGLAALILWAWSYGEFRPTKPGDMPSWWMYLVGAAITFGAFCLVTGGIGRMVSAFARDCTFRGGPDGLLIRLPKQGWFGQYRIVEYRIGWNQIKGLVHFTHRVNLIPVSTELRIEPYTGKIISIERHFFHDSIKNIQKRLISIQAAVAR